MKAKDLKLLRELFDDLESESILINDIKQDLKYVCKHNLMSIRTTAKIVKSPSELTFHQFGTEYTLSELIYFHTNKYRTKVKVGLQQLLASGFTREEVVEEMRMAYREITT